LGWLWHLGLTDNSGKNEMNRYHPISLGRKIEQASSFHHLEDDFEILRIYVSSKGQEIHLVKFNSFLAYRKILDSYAFKTIDELAGLGLSKQLFFEVKQSDFLEWFSSQASALAENMTHKHYLISLEDCFIEILSEELPTVELAVVI
jgi:hypothetical protein